MKVCILDGWGENVNKDEWNAIHIAETPVTDGLRKHEGRWRTVQAHGTAVGLPSDAGKILLPFNLRIIDPYTCLLLV